LYVNLYKSPERVGQSVRGYYVKLEGLQIEKKTDRTAFLQAIANPIARKGYDTCVIPDDLSDNFDIILLNVDENQVSQITSKYSNLGPKIVKTDIRRNDIIAKAWQNRVRVELARKGFLRIGDRYVSEQETKDKQKKFRKAFRIQAFLINGFPSVFIDPRTRIMIPLGDDKIRQAETAGTGCASLCQRQRQPVPRQAETPPHPRVQRSSDFMRNYFDSIFFLGRKISFEGPMAARDLNYTEYTFSPQNSFELIVGNSQMTTFNGLHRALRLYGPYSGRLDGKYVVIHCGNGDRISEALKSLERVYLQLNLGRFAPLSSVGASGFVDAGGESVADYTSTIAELRATFMEKREKLIAIIVLPDVYSSEIYFKSRGQLFERVFGAEPVPAQAISYESLEKIAEENKSSYAICVNTAAQCYIKLGGTGTAAWVLKDAADIKIPGILQGSSCYAYHDVSRRPKLKASATAYSALTDSYGRYIATGTKPVGGEKLTPSSFYDILVELLQKISIFSKRYGTISNERAFSFKRLVFAKDGMLKGDEAEMMEDVIMNGLPEERKPPIPELLKKIAMLPKSLTIDIIGVNKTPNKRIFNRVNERFVNVPQGTAISYDDDNGLLVSCSSRIGTVQPLEISLHRHLCLNGGSIPKPHISQIMDEYYRLTFLNWSSIFKQGKYALPQILTQNLGENISAGVLVPDDMILL
jgi:hypothetical protein